MNKNQAQNVNVDLNPILRSMSFTLCRLNGVKGTQSSQRLPLENSPRLVLTSLALNLEGVNSVLTICSFSTC